MRRKTLRQGNANSGQRLPKDGEERSFEVLTTPTRPQAKALLLLKIKLKLETENSSESSSKMAPTIVFSHFSLKLQFNYKVRGS